TPTPLQTLPSGLRPPAWRRQASPRTAKRAAGLPTPLEGPALAVTPVMVQPDPMNGELRPRAMPGSRTPEKGGVAPAHCGGERALPVVDRCVAAELGELVAGVDRAGGAGLGGDGQGLGGGAAAGRGGP